MSFLPCRQQLLLKGSCTKSRRACQRSQRSTSRISAVLQKPPPSTESSKSTGPFQPELSMDYLSLTSKLDLSPSSAALHGGQKLPLTRSCPDTVWHFAYGANMNFYTLAKRGVRVLSRESAFIRDERVHMVFRHRGGYASLARLEAGESPMMKRYTRHAHGVLYEITKEDLKKLEAKEGGYMLKEFEVETYGGHVERAVAFVSDPMATLPQEVAPTERYMMVLRDGAGDNYLEPLHQAWLSSIPTVPSAGLPAHYYDTPSKYLAYGFVASFACLVLSFHLR